MSDVLATEGKPSPLGRVGRYVLRSELASGGMATVYLAHLQGPHGFEKVVAVKRIHPHLTSDRRFVSMFLDEARVAALIHHPNVCAVTDFGEIEGAPYLVMEYLSGESFSAVLKQIRHHEGPNPFWLSARIVHDAARGLHTAHMLKGADGELLGVVHRDVSPQNIFVLYDGVTKVVDFGVARARGRLSTTQTNEVKGKLPFMSPEQFENLNVDARTDLWALGVVLWEATVGRRLFRGQNDAATINLVLHKPIPRPSDFVPDFPAKLENIIMRCLERDPSQRYQTGDELADDLEEFLYAFGKPAGASQVKKWMESTFAEQIVYRESLLRGDSPLPVVVSTDSDSDSSLSSIRSRIDPQDEAALATVAKGRPRALRVAPERAEARKAERKPTLAFALLIAAAVATMLAVVARDQLFGRDEQSARGSAPVAVPERTAEPAVVDTVALGPSAPVPNPPTPSVQAPNVVAPVRAEPTRAPLEPRAVVPTPEERVVEERPAPAPAPIPAREEPPSAPAHEAESAPGMLSLIAIPSASVRVDGRPEGDTPLRVSLPAGSHRVELRDAEGHVRTLTVRIESGVTTRQRVEF